MDNVNPLKWTKDQWAAAGRHVVTATGTALAILLWFHIIPDVNAKAVADNVGIIVDSLTKIALAVGAIVTALAPLWALIKASSTAAPENQAKATIANLDKGVPLNGTKDVLINAVANQPEVKKIEMVDKAKADTLSSEKVQ